MDVLIGYSHICHSLNGGILKFGILAIIFFVIGGFLYVQPMNPAEWKYSVLDTVHPERFVAMDADKSGNPHIIYYNERDGGVLHMASKPSKYAAILSIFGNSLASDIDYYLNGRNWVNETIDSGKHSGMFVSVVADPEGGIHAAYQDATFGSEKLMYAFYDGSNWKTEVVDDVSSGVNVGMYTSITYDSAKKSPVIFYHIEQGRKFAYAEKINRSWKKTILETGRGWLTSTVSQQDSCENGLFTAYRGRDNQNIFMGKLMNSAGVELWSSQDIGRTTPSGISMAMKNCKPYIAYFSETNGKVMLNNPETHSDYVIGDAKMSRISIDADDNGFYVLYNIYEKGLMYAHSPDGINWTQQFIDTGRRDGEYNAISVEENSNIYIVYLNSTALKYAEYNVSSAKSVKKVRTYFAAISFIIGILLSYNYLRRRKKS